MLGGKIKHLHQLHGSGEIRMPAISILNSKMIKLIKVMMVLLLVHACFGCINENNFKIDNKYECPLRESLRKYNNSENAIINLAINRFNLEKEDLLEAIERALSICRDEGDIRGIQYKGISIGNESKEIDLILKRFNYNYDFALFTEKRAYDQEQLTWARGYLVLLKKIKKWIIVECIERITIVG